MVKNNRAGVEKKSSANKIRMEWRQFETALSLALSRDRNRMTTATEFAVPLFLISMKLDCFAVPCYFQQQHSRRQTVVVILTTVNSFRNYRWFILWQKYTRSTSTTCCKMKKKNYKSKVSHSEVNFKTSANEHGERIKENISGQSQFLGGGVRTLLFVFKWAIH